MEITYLGHAGFWVETDEAVILMDPWFTERGAFAASWFQNPRNDFLADEVRRRLADADKARFLYVSHEHQDHFDPDFLASLVLEDTTIIVPLFRNSRLRDALGKFAARSSVVCEDNKRIEFPGGYMVVFVDDRELNRDSAILVRADGTTFLNLNDCKIHERVPEIVEQHGPIDVYTCQFSGASWHPTSYDYPDEQYEEIVRSKRRSKFRAVVQSVLAAEPRYYLPSAGPPVFLDSRLHDAMRDRETPFPSASEFYAYLGGEWPAIADRFLNLSPGATLDLRTGSVQTDERSDASSGRNSLDVYASDRAAVLAAIDERYRAATPETTWARLTRELERKLALFDLDLLTNRPLFVGLVDHPGKWLRVDFGAKSVIEVEDIPQTDYYRIAFPSWLVDDVMDGRISWEDAFLSMRLDISREPDEYDVNLQAFMLLDPEDYPSFVKSQRSVHPAHARAIAKVGDRCYSFDRYCPHLGGDLAQGWIEGDRYLVCPRHRWRYDPLDGGKRDSQGHVSIHSVLVEGDCSEANLSSADDRSPDLANERLRSGS